IGSLVFGLIAWILPVVNIMRYRDQNYENWILLSVVSLSACSVSLFLWIYSFYERVKAEDWGALMDTISVIASVPAILLIGTIILNAITLILYRYRTTK